MRLDIGLVNELTIDYVVTPPDSIFVVGFGTKRIGMSEEQWAALDIWLTENCLVLKPNRYYTVDEKKISMFLLKFA